MLASPNAKLAVPPHSTKVWRRMLIAGLVVSIGYLVSRAIERVTGIPVVDFLITRFLALLGLSNESKFGKAATFLAVGVCWIYIGVLVDRYLVRDLDFFLFSSPSEVLKPLPPLGSSKDWAQLMQGDFETACMELEEWVFLGSEETHWGRWWNAQDKENAFRIKKLSIANDVDRDVLACALARYLETLDKDVRSPGTPRILLSLARLYRTACLTRSLKSRRLPWDVGLIAQDHDGHPPGKRMATWRPRRPTLLLLRDPAEEFQKQIIAALKDSADSYHYPVRLLLLRKPDFPDVLASLRGQTGAITYRAAEFTGRQWFTRHISERVEEFGLKGGVIILEAPMGWGKTALALRWVEATQHWLQEQKKHSRRGSFPVTQAPNAGEPLLLDGWAFARETRGASVDLRRLSCNLNTIVCQLDACARSRLDISPSHALADGPISETIRELLEDCGECGCRRGLPVVLLLDAVDEIDFTGDVRVDNINALLPSEWPKGVVLLMLTRTLDGDEDSNRLRDNRERQVYYLDVEIGDPQLNRQGLQREAYEANEEDIRCYIDHRLSELEDRYRQPLSDEPFKEALWTASEGYFIVISGLLNEGGDGSAEEQKENFLSELQQWRSNPAKYLPYGPAKFFERQIERKQLHLAQLFKSRVLTRGVGDPEHFAFALLAMMATRKGPQRASEFLGILIAMKAACQSRDEHSKQAWLAVWGLLPVLGPAELHFWEGLLALRGLFSAGVPTDAVDRASADANAHTDLGINFKLNFTHSWLPVIIKQKIEKTHRAGPIHELWAALCAHQLTVREGAQNADSVAQYVDAFGIDHLLDAGYLADALKLRATLTLRWNANEREPLRKLARFSKNIAESIDRAVLLATLDNHYAEALRSINPEHLVDLLRARVYLTGLYTAVLRTLLTYHAPNWRELDTRMAELIGASDIVFRHDFGEAYAAVWECPEMRTSVTSAVRAMAAGKTDSSAEDADIVAYKREIAGYALKFIWREAGADETGLAHFDPEIIRIYGTSKSPTDRMIASELLLSYAIGTGHDPSAVIPEPLLHSKWPYHQCDILDLQYVVAPDKLALVSNEDVPVALRACACEHLKVDQQRRALLQQTLARDTPELNCLLQDDAYQMQLNGSEDLLPKALEVLRPIFADRTSAQRDVAKDIVRVLLSHPVWNVTETVTGVLSDIITDYWDNRKLVMELLQDESWRVRYGALDVSFNIGHNDGFKTFQNALLSLMKKERHCRVLGLCGDNFLGWLRDGAGSDEERKRILDIHDIQVMVHEWVRTADDYWLLEYVYLLFCYLDKIGLPFQVLLPAPAQWSRYLVGQCPFYQCGHTEFLERIEDNRIRDIEATE